MNVKPMKKCCKSKYMEDQIGDVQKLLVLGVGLRQLRPARSDCTSASL